MASESYLTAAAIDSTAEGNFAHGGGLVLVDGFKRIRGVYDGTDSLETKRLIKDIKILLMENTTH
jgi:protein SCO1/2